MSRREIQAGKAVIVVDLVDRATANIGKITSKFMAAANAFRDIGRTATAGSFLTGMVSANILRKFTDFEDQMLNLAAKLGYFGQMTIAQTRNLESLKKTIIDLARSTSYTSKEVADAAVSLAQAGFSVTEIRSSLQAVLDLARGTNYELGETADLLANTVRTFNLMKSGQGPEVLAENMRTVSHVASMMVKATRLGTIEIQDLRESLKYAAGSANNLGSNLPVVLGLLVQMSESGLKASLAGTSMNTAFLNMIQNMEQLQEKAQGFTLFKDAEGKIDFAATFKSLMDATKFMDRQQKTKLFQDIFNIRGARMVSSVQEMERVEYFIKEIALAGEEARLSAAKMESGLGGAIRRLTSAMDALQIAWGYTFKDGATAIANFATVGVNALENLTVKHKAMIAGLVLSPVIFAGIAVASYTLSMVLSRLTYVIAGLGSALRGLQFLGGKMGASIMNLASPVTAMRAASQAKAKDYRRLQEKVAKQGAAIDARIAKAQAAKDPAKALGRVFAGKQYQAYMSNAMKLQGTRPPGLNIIAQMQAALKMFGQQSKSTRTIIQGLIAVTSTFFRIPMANSKEMWIKLRNIKNMFKELVVVAKNAPSTFTKAMLALSSKIPTKSRSLEGLKGIGKYMNQVRGGLVTGTVPNILNTKQLTSSIKLLQSGSLVKSAVNLSRLGVGFAKLTMSMTRFVFSWNFVGLVFNALLMFGDKIQVIRDIFSSFAKGFSAAFTQIGKIATYAAPAMNLFKLAFDSFLQGNTGTGITAVTAAFQGLVGIIGNQLYAAWNAFAARVEYIWLVIKQIGTAIWIVIDSLMSGVISAVTAVVSPLTDGLKAMSGGQGNLAEKIMSVIQSLGSYLSWFISAFFKAVITFHEYGLQFLNMVQRRLGQVIDKIPGTGNAGKELMETADGNDAVDSLRASKLRADINIEENKRQKALKDIMEVTAEQLKSVRLNNVARANQSSQNIAGSLQQLFEKLRMEQEGYVRARAAEEERLKAIQGRSTSAPSKANAPAVLEKFALKLQAVVGSIGAASKARMLVEVPSMVSEQQQTNEKLDELIRVNKTNAAF